MAILITGGTGFVGGTIVNELVANQKEWGIKKEDIFVLVRDNNNVEVLEKLGVKYVVGDLTDHDSLIKAVKGKSIIFHLGAVVLDQSAPEILHQVNVLGTKALLEASISEKAVEKFVFVSTWGVYGYKIKSNPMRENQPFNPTNDYHKSKVEAEKLVWEYSKSTNLSVTVVRLPMILGPGDTLTTPRVIQAFFDKKVKMIGKGKNLYSGVHVVDAARAIIAMGINKKSVGNVYHVKSFDISQRDYWFEYRKAINNNEKIPVLPKWAAMLYSWSKEIGAKIKGQGKPTLTRHRVMRYGNTRILDISKIKNDLNWEPIFIDGKRVIHDSVKWLNENNFINFQNKKVILLRKWEDHLKKNYKESE